MSAAANTSAASRRPWRPPCVRVVVHPDALAGIVLDGHLVAVRDGLAHAAGNEPDAVFEDLYFLRDADAHEDLMGWGSSGNAASAPRRHRGRTTRRSPLAKV